MSSSLTDRPTHQQPNSHVSSSANQKLVRLLRDEPHHYKSTRIINTSSKSLILKCRSYRRIQQPKIVNSSPPAKFISQNQTTTHRQQISSFEVKPLQDHRGNIQSVKEKTHCFNNSKMVKSNKELADGNKEKSNISQIVNKITKNNQTFDIKECISKVLLNLERVEVQRNNKSAISKPNTSQSMQYSQIAKPKESVLLLEKHPQSYESIIPRDTLNDREVNFFGMKALRTDRNIVKVKSKKSILRVHNPLLYA